MRFAFAAAAFIVVLIGAFVTIAVWTDPAGDGASDAGGLAEESRACAPPAGVRMLSNTDVIVGQVSSIRPGAPEDRAELTLTIHAVSAQTPEVDRPNVDIVLRVWSEEIERLVSGDCVMATLDPDEQGLVGQSLAKFGEWSTDEDDGCTIVTPDVISGSPGFSSDSVLSGRIAGIDDTAFGESGDGFNWHRIDLDPASVRTGGSDRERTRARKLLRRTSVGRAARRRPVRGGRRQRDVHRVRPRVRCRRLRAGCGPGG